MVRSLNVGTYSTVHKITSNKHNRRVNKSLASSWFLQDVEVSSSQERDSSLPGKKEFLHVNHRGRRERAAAE